MQSMKRHYFLSNIYKIYRVWMYTYNSPNSIAQFIWRNSKIKPFSLAKRHHCRWILEFSSYRIDIFSSVGVTFIPVIVIMLFISDKMHSIWTIEHMYNMLLRNVHILYTHLHTIFTYIVLEYSMEEREGTL